MANPLEVYRSQRASAWTRVDMVVALYDEAIKRIDQALEAIERSDLIASRQHGLRILQLIACLRSGVDAQAGNLPQDILRLYNFIDRCVAEGTREHLQYARQVIVPLRDSFQEIRDNVAELERAGEIPPLSFAPQSCCNV